MTSFDHILFSYVIMSVDICQKNQSEFNGELIFVLLIQGLFKCVQFLRRTVQRLEQ